MVNVIREKKLTMILAVLRISWLRQPNHLGSALVLLWSVSTFGPHDGDLD